METKINSGTRNKDLIANHSSSRSLTPSTYIIITLTRRKEGGPAAGATKGIGKVIAELLSS